MDDLFTKATAEQVVSYIKKMILLAFVMGAATGSAVVAVVMIYGNGGH